MRLVTIQVLCTVIMLVQGTFVWSATDADKSVKLAILPLDVVRTGQYSYLNSSIEQMLITRLSRFKTIDIVTSEASGTQLATLRQTLKSDDFDAVAQQLDVDWVADGSVYSLKQGIKMNVALYPATDGAEPALLGITAERPDDILPALTSLTADIGRILTGVEQKQDDGESGETENDGMSAFRTPHPELAYKKGIYSAGGLTGDQKGRFSTSQILRSSSIPIIAESMVVADMDGDGNEDLIVASQDEIRIFHYNDYRFDQVAAYSFRLNKKIHALSVLPAGQDTKAKLLVSADGEKKPASVILSWDGSNTLQLEQDDISAYIRTVTVPDKGTFIAGQSLKPQTDLWQLAPGVYRLKQDEHTGRLVKDSRLVLPEQTKLFDFAYVDLNNDSTLETIVIDERQKLLVYNENNELLWVSSESYGGGMSFYGQSLNKEQDNEKTDGRILQHIPGRLEIKDIDHNGIPEIIVSTNSVGSILRYFPNLKSFNGGSVACLGWSNGGLQELWRTNKISGYIADYAFNTGAPGASSAENNAGRLYIAQTKSKSMLPGLLPGSETTKIFIFDINISTPDEKQAQ